MLRSRLTGDLAAPLVLSLVAASTAAADADPEVSSCLLQATVDQSMDVIQTIERFISNRQAGKLISCASAREPGCFLALAGGLRTIPFRRTGSNPTY